MFGLNSVALTAAADRAGYVLDAEQRLAIERVTGASGRGVYLYGSVGRGKTWLSDAIVAAQPPETRVLRVHFHGFLAELNAAIFRHGFNAEAALDELLGEVDLVHFDEFHANDVGDATLLARALDALLSRPLVALFTSNDAPEDLLPNPQFHELFRPSIERIRAELTVVRIGDGPDYRRDEAGRGSRPRAGFASGAWVVDPVQAPEPGTLELTVNGRPLLVTEANGAETAAGQLRIGFAELCGGPTAPADYRLLADRFPSWELTGIPAATRMDPSAAKRFANVIDVLVDRDVRLVARAATPRSALALAPELPSGSARMLSRLALLRAR